MTQSNLTRRNLFVAAAAGVGAAVVAPASAEADPLPYDFRVPAAELKTAFLRGTYTPYKVAPKGHPATGRTGPDNLRWGIADYQWLLDNVWKIPTAIDGVYGPGTARSAAKAARLLAPVARQLGIDLGVPGTINTNLSYLLVLPEVQRYAREAGVRPGLLSVHLREESGGYDLGAIYKNPNKSGLDAYDLGPVELSVPQHRDLTPAAMFSVSTISIMAHHDATNVHRYGPENELLAAYHWNSPANADAIFRGAAPTQKAQNYMGFLAKSMPTYGQDVVLPRPGLSLS